MRHMLSLACLLVSMLPAVMAQGGMIREMCNAADIAAQVAAPLPTAASA